jgi:hypothetical protein
MNFRAPVRIRRRGCVYSGKRQRLSPPSTQETPMKTSLKTRFAALIASLAVTLLCVHAIADYAYPESADARVALASPR